MHDRVFRAEQLIPRPRAEVFAFFCDPANLERITPPWLRFRILGRSSGEMRAGTELTYALRLRGLPLTWVSRISEWVPGERFCDEQIRGPYALWRHTHRFEDRGDGTWMEDHVVYRLPLAPWSHLLAGPLVAADIRRIFRYRRQVIDRLFAPAAAAEVRP